MSQRRLILAGFFCLAAANAVPAFRYSPLPKDILYGWQASCLAFIAMVFLGLLERGASPAAVLGVIANLGFLATFIAVLVGRSKVAKRTAVTAAASAFGSVGFLATGSEIFVPYLGCVLWLATGVLLVLGSLAIAPIAQQGAQPDTDKPGD